MASRDPLDYEVLKESTNYILQHTDHRPKIGIIFGTGIDPYVDGLTTLVEDADVISFSDIPNFPQLRHNDNSNGRILIGLLNKVPVFIMEGRYHAYEGYSLRQTVVPIRVMKLLGIESIIATSAGGGLNKAIQVGDIMVLSDHIYLPGFACQNPLRGPHDERFGPRFFPTNDLYSTTYRRMARKVGVSLRLEGLIREGVYAMVGGPNYETVAELKMLRELGVDCVGMSTIPETMVAHHCGIKVFACSLITNQCIAEYGTGLEIKQKEVMETCKRRAPDLKMFITELVKKMHEE